MLILQIKFQVDQNHYLVATYYNCLVDFPQDVMKTLAR